MIYIFILYIVPILINLIGLYLEKYYNDWLLALVPGVNIVTAIMFLIEWVTKIKSYFIR